MIDRIGVVGHGFVGRALENGMKHAYEVLVYDPVKYPESYAGVKLSYDISVVHSFDTLTSACNVIFVCVPTPMNDDGSANTGIVESVVESIASFERRNVVVIKSTVPPGTTERLHGLYANSSERGKARLAGVVFNPEFLTEANFLEDFKNQNRIILGSLSDSAKSTVKRVYQKAYPRVPTVKTNPTIAEMVKYITNCFLATKVSFANEIFQVCEKLKIDYDKVIEYACFDERLGKSHWAVPGPMPGPDDQMLPGFSGSCFPKDLNALIACCKQLGVDPTVMQAAWKKNVEVRPGRDWELLLGRAVMDAKKHD